MLTFRVLGEISAEFQGRRVDLKSPQQRALFGLLVLGGGHSVSTDQLVERMWGPQADGSLRSTVRTYVLRLRRAFVEVGFTEPVIETLSYGYRLVAPREIDLEVFADQVASARAARGRGELAEASALFADALAQWRGVPFSGARAFYVDDERSRLEQVRIAAVEERIGLDLSVGRDAMLESELMELVAAHPLRERLVEFLMLALYRNGRQADALEAYQRVRRLLDEELGVEPGHGLREMQRRILQADPTLFPNPTTPPPVEVPADAHTPTEGPIPIRDSLEVRAGSSPSPAGLPDPAAAPSELIAARQLPADTVDFTGRNGCLARLSRHLIAAQGPALIGLCGLDGAGKTTLALRLAHTVRDRFPDGQLYADLGGSQDHDEVAPPSALEVLGRFLRALGVSGPLPEQFEERAVLWRSFLADRRVLVVLDDVRCPDQLSALLPATAGSAAIVTSVRSFDATALSWDRVGPMSPVESGELFDKIAGPDRRHHEPDAWAGLLTITSGYPWAVRMVARRAAARPFWRLADVLDQLRDDTNTPTGLHEDCRRIKRAVHRSVRLLDGEIATAFRLLGVAQISHFCAESAAALWHTHRARALAVLDELAEVHLLERGPHGTFGMITPVRAYARVAAREIDHPDTVRAAICRLRLFYKESENNATITRDNRRGPAGPVYQTQLWNGIRFANAHDAEHWLIHHRPDLRALTEQLLHFSPAHAPITTVPTPLTQVPYPALAPAQLDPISA